MPPLLDFEDKSLNNYFLGSNQCMWITDTGLLSVLEVNEASFKICGYNREEIVLQPVEKIIPNREKQKLLQSAADTSTAKQFAKTEISLINRSGKTVHAEIVVSAILYHGKEARFLTMTDVTEKKLYRAMLEEAIDEEISLKDKNQKLKKLAYHNFHQARKPLANILGLVNVMDQSVISDKTLSEAIGFLKESGNELDELIKNLDPQFY